MSDTALKLHGMIGAGLSSTDKQNLIAVANEAESNNSTVKTSLATLMGAPTVSTETIGQMVTDLTTQKNNLVANVNTLGQSVTGSSSLKNVVDAVGSVINKVGSNTVINPSTTDQIIARGYYDGTSSSGKVAATTGTANPSDVAVGKTFNSASGIGQVGTKPISSINGIINNYLVSSSGSVTTGDFLKYVNDMGSSVTIDTTVGSGVYISATELTPTSVFVAYCSDQTNYHLMGSIITISNKLIATYTSYTLSNTTIMGVGIRVTALSPTSVFIAHGYNNTLHGMVCTISGNTITPGVDTNLSSNIGNSAQVNLSIVTLSSTSVFITHCVNGSSLYLYGIVCNISGLSIAPGTDTQISSTIYTGAYSSVTVLSPTSVFVAHSFNSAYYLHGMVCTISGTTITPGTDVELDTYINLCAVSTVTLTPNSVAIVYISTATQHPMYSTVCTITGTVVTKGKIGTVIGGTGSTASLSTVALSSISVLVFFADNSNQALDGVIITLDAVGLLEVGAVTFINTTANSGNYISATVLSTLGVFIAHNNDLTNCLAGQIFSRAVNKVISISDLVMGVASSTGSAGTVVSAYVPNVS